MKPRQIKSAVHVQSGDEVSPQTGQNKVLLVAKIRVHQSHAAKLPCVAKPDVVAQICNQLLGLRPGLCESIDQIGGVFVSIYLVLHVPRSKDGDECNSNQHRNSSDDAIE